MTPSTVGSQGKPTRTSIAAPASLALTGAFVLALTIWGAVRTESGQRFDLYVLWGARLSEWGLRLLQRGLDLVSVTHVAIVLVALLALGLWRRQWLSSLFAVVFIAGANVITQLLKYVLLQRPDLGFDDMNTLPSGHVTVLTSVAAAAVLVAGRRYRSLVVAAATAVAVLAGAAVLLNRYHRPSDVIAAYCVCALWAGVLGLGVQRFLPDPSTDRRRPRFRRSFGRYLPIALGAMLAMLGFMWLLNLQFRPSWNYAPYIPALVLLLVALVGTFTMAAVGTLADVLGHLWRTAPPGDGVAAPDDAPGADRKGRLLSRLGIG